MSTFVEIHAIHSVPPSNLNRDDTGSPKSAIVGGVKRHRVSSQSWKKAIRDYFQENNEVANLGIRTKNIGTLLANKIQEINPEATREEALSLAVEAMKALKIIGKAKAADAEIVTADALFLISDAQIESVARILVEEGDQFKAASLKKSLISNNSLDLALFGRMVASDPDLNVEAAAQFAHAFSTHETTSEFDFFTAVDDFSETDHAGAGMMGDIEFTSSTLYRYAAINITALAAQFGEDEETVAQGVARFLNAFLRAMPSGKQNSFAALTLPEAFIVKVTDGQPISLANAFEKPVKAGTEGYSLASVRTLVEAIAESNEAYGEEGTAFATGLTQAARDELNKVALTGNLAETIDSISQELS